jgi:hypothetical protein
MPTNPDPTPSQPKTNPGPVTLEVDVQKVRELINEIQERLGEIEDMIGRAPDGGQQPPKNNP